jgi:uncharacterized repeat protein (TIGR03803 family)
MLRITDLASRAILGCCVAVVGLGSFGSAYGAGFQVLYQFQGKQSGAAPVAGLIADAAGNLYGTTQAGGQGGKTGLCGGGCGTVFKLAPDGTETVLYAFKYAKNQKDGSIPKASLIADGAGNLYGTTEEGAGNGCGGFGCGTVFKLTPHGKETVLYAFKGGSNDGDTPQAGLIADSAGNLYGTTSFGGSFAGADCDQVGCGTIFKLAPNGTETVLYKFNGETGSDGAVPLGNLIADAAGNLYGTTVRGGSTGCTGSGCGTVFKLAPNGTETVLYTFQGGLDGANPLGSLIADAAGNLYGTTENGGSTGCFNNGGCGTVFKIAPDGTETLLYAFQGGSDGINPEAGLVADASGNLYGTTTFGGAKMKGTVFRLAPNGTETVLYSFQGKSDGGVPYAGLISDAAGNLYGTTEFGGVSKQYGVVFKIPE